MRMASPDVQCAGDIDCVPHQGVRKMDCAPAPKVGPPASDPAPEKPVGIAPPTAVVGLGTDAAPFTQDQLSVKTSAEPSGVRVWHPMHWTWPSVKPVTGV